MTTTAQKTAVGIAQTATRADIAVRVNEFVNNWAGERRERAEKDSFWNDFFAIFGISRRRVGGVFEYVAQRHSTGRHGFMDLFWPGKVAVEPKSAGAGFSTAMDQLVDYLIAIDPIDIPALAVVCDFDLFVVRDLEAATTVEFSLEQLPAHIDIFTYLAGYLVGPPLAVRQLCDSYLVLRGPAFPAS